MASAEAVAQAFARHRFFNRNLNRFNLVNVEIA